MGIVADADDTIHRQRSARVTFLRWLRIKYFCTVGEGTPAPFNVRLP
jgi:hypothetical protein